MRVGRGVYGDGVLPREDVAGGSGGGSRRASFGICLVFGAEGGGGGIEIGSVLHVASAISALSLLDVPLRRAVGRTAVRRALIRAIAAVPLQRRI